MTQLFDAESYIDISRSDLVPLVEATWRREAESGLPTQVMITDVGDPIVGRRLRTPELSEDDRADGRLVFPDHLAGLGLNPLTELHVALAEAYARWLTEHYLPSNANDHGMLYLPAVSPEACLRIVQTYGNRPNVAGAYVTTNGTLQPHDNRMCPVYAEMQERGMMLAFLPTPSWPDQPFDTLDHYLAFWAVGTPFHQSFTVINWLIHGMPERFPKLRCLFCGSGVVWVSFLAHRMDREFLQRPSEAPLLSERPSHYFRRFFYTTYPIERVRDLAYLEATFRLVGTERLLYGSGFPHWDSHGSDLVHKMSFLNDGERQAILYDNATGLLGL